MIITAKEKAQEIYHECLNTGEGYISDYLAGKFAFLILEKMKYNTDNKVYKELKKLLNHK